MKNCNKMIYSTYFEWNCLNSSGYMKIVHSSQYFLWQQILTTEFGREWIFSKKLKISFYIEFDLTVFQLSKKIHLPDKALFSPAQRNKTRDNKHIFTSHQSADLLLRMKIVESKINCLFVFLRIFPGCYLNGQLVADGREVTSSEDPCLKCSCSNKRLTCMKKACPVLQCPLSKQVKLSGECCPKCSEKRMITQFAGKCILGKGFHSNGMQYAADQCSSCTCMNGTSVCQRNTCPVLECIPAFQKQLPGECCPSCPPMAEARSTCTYEEKTYHVRNEKWWMFCSVV